MTKTEDLAFSKALDNYGPDLVVRLKPKQAFVVGDKYNWKNQSERLIYLGHNFSGNGYWHQFAKIEEPSKIWCEVLTGDLHMIEPTERTPAIEDYVVTCDNEGADRAN